VAQVVDKEERKKSQICLVSTKVSPEIHHLEGENQELFRNEVYLAVSSKSSLSMEVWSNYGR
jgi:hypothetical protein